MQRCTDGVAVRGASDRCGGGDASGMPDPEVCVSGGGVFCLCGVLAGEEMKKRCVIGIRKPIRKASFTHMP